MRAFSVEMPWTALAAAGISHPGSASQLWASMRGSADDVVSGKSMFRHEDVTTVSYTHLTLPTKA